MPGFVIFGLQLVGLCRRSGFRLLRATMASWIPAVQILTALSGNFSVRRSVDNISIVFTAAERDTQTLCEQYCSAVSASAHLLSGSAIHMGRRRFRLTEVYWQALVN